VSVAGPDMTITDSRPRPDDREANITGPERLRDADPLSLRGPVVKEAIADALLAEMRRQSVTKAELARRLNTSRSQLDRLLDPENDRIALVALCRVAAALGRRLRVSLISDVSAR
jgi:transcriptional regulator with XRE-family HTH domain